MKSFVINLDRRRDRWAKIKKRLNSAGVTLERISATTPCNLPEMLVKANGRLPQGLQLSDGELACYCSHVRVLQMIADGPDDWAIVMEDDAVPAPSFGSVVQLLPAYLKRPCVVRVDRTKSRLRLRMPRRKGPDGFQIYRVGEFDPGACAYIVDRDAARLLVKDAYDRPVPVDLWLFDLHFPKPTGLISNQLVPAIAMQEHVLMGLDIADSDSDLQPMRNNRIDDFEVPALADDLSFFPKELARLNRRLRKMGRRYNAGNSVFYRSKRVPIPYEGSG